MPITKFLISWYVGLIAGFNPIEDNIPQPKYTSEQKYKFIKYDQNRIFTPQINTLIKLNEAFDALINGRRKKVNIVHFGDSHIQADHFSGEMRSHFNDEKLLGNGGRGYLFPCSMANTSNPHNIKVSYKGIWNGCRNVELYKSCSWGLSGMTSTTSNVEATFTIDPNLNNANHKYEITRVKVYYQVSNKNSYYVKLMLPNGVLYPVRLDVDGYAEFILPVTEKTITIGLEKRFDHQNFFTLEGISFENDNKGIQYNAVGVNSATVPSFLKMPKFESHLKSLSPDLVIVSLGTNDAYTPYFNPNQYKINLARLIQKIKNAVPNASILLTTPNDCALYGRFNKANQEATRVIMELSTEANCAVWDVFTIMGGLGSINQWLGAGLAAGDRIHLTGKGYRLQGDLLYDALITNYGDYYKKKPLVKDKKK